MEGLKMSDDKKMNPFEIDNSSKIYCLNLECANNVTGQNTCNLKGVLISEFGMCSGIVKIKALKKKAKR